MAPGHLPGLTRIIWPCFCSPHEVQARCSLPDRFSHTMQINRQEYDNLPFGIRQGALQLWGTYLTSYVCDGQCRRLYSFSGFFAELCYCNQQLTCICTFSASDGLEPYIEHIRWQDLV